MDWDGQQNEKNFHWFLVDTTSLRLVVSHRIVCVVKRWQDVKEKKGLYYKILALHFGFYVNFMLKSTENHTEKKRSIWSLVLSSCTLLVEKKNLFSILGFL